MTELWVANASPMILLGKVGHGDLLVRLSRELIIPERVAKEVSVRPEGRELVAELGSLPEVRLEQHVAVAPEIRAWDLGAGESQVLSLASGSSGRRAVVDDLQARRCAESLGVPVIGVLGVVLRAKRKKLIPAARPVVVALRDAGLYVSDRLVEQALSHLAE